MVSILTEEDEGHDMAIFLQGKSSTCRILDVDEEIGDIIVRRLSDSKRFRITGLPAAEELNG